jgi:hypothetical protein
MLHTESVLTVTVMPAFTVTGPPDKPLEPVGTVKSADTAFAFRDMPLVDDVAIADNMPVLGV